MNTARPARSRLVGASNIWCAMLREPLPMPKPMHSSLDPPEELSVTDAVHCASGLTAICAGGGMGNAVVLDVMAP